MSGIDNPYLGYGRNSDPMTNLVIRLEPYPIWGWTHHLPCAVWTTCLPEANAHHWLWHQPFPPWGFCTGSARFTIIDHRSENRGLPETPPRPCTMYRKIIVVDLGFRLDTTPHFLLLFFCLGRRRLAWSCPNSKSDRLSMTKTHDKSTRIRLYQSDCCDKSRPALPACLPRCSRLQQLKPFSNSS